MRNAVGVLGIKKSDFWNWVRENYKLTEDLIYDKPILDRDSHQLILYPQYEHMRNNENNVYIDGVEFWTWIHNKYFNDGMERIFEQNIYYHIKGDVLMDLYYAESDSCDPLSWLDDFKLKLDWLKG